MKKFCNILLIVLLAVTVLLAAYAVISKPETLNAAISLNLIWGYVLFAAAALAAVGCAVWGLVKSPAGLKGAILSLFLVAAVIVISYFIANGHDYHIVNLEDGGYFERGEAVIADASILVTYVAFVGAVVAALYSEIANVLK